MGVWYLEFLGKVQMPHRELGLGNQSEAATVPVLGRQISAFSFLYLLRRFFFFTKIMPAHWREY